MADLGTLLIRFGADTSSLISGFGKAESMISGFGGIVAGIGLAAGVAVVGIGAASVKMAADFQESTNRLVTSAGETRSNLDMVRSGILKMSVDTASSWQQLSDGMYMVESAGYHGADGLKVLQAAAEGAKAENANLADVANAVTSALNAYHMSAGDAIPVTNILVAAVGAGKMRMQDLAVAMKNVLPVSATFGISLKDTAAAIATMTMQGDDAASAATHLRQMILALEAPSKIGAKALASVGLSSAEVSAEMRKSLPGAVDMIYEALHDKFPKGGDAYNQALKNIAGGSKQMLAILELGGKHLQVFRDDVSQITKAVKEGGNSILGWASIQDNFNFKLEAAKNAVSALMINIGTGLLPVLGQLLTLFTSTVIPGIIAFGHTLQQVWNILNDEGLGILIASLQHLGAVIIGIVMPALRPIGTLLSSMFSNSSILSGAHSLEGVFYRIADAINVVSTIVQAGANIFKTVILPVLVQVGAFLASTFKPVWDQLVQTWKDQLLPSLKQLWAALVPLLPLLQFLGAIIGGVIVVVLILFVSALAGVIKALAGLLVGVIIIVGGIVQLFTGLVQIIAGVIRVIIDIVTGNFTDLGPALEQIWAGIVNIFQGVWQIIKGIFVGAFGAIIGFVTGFFGTMVSIFTNLANTLVGHSIIPDMINAIIKWFTDLPGKAVSAVQGLASQLAGFFGGLATQAIQWGTNIIQGIVTGIQNMLGNVATAAGNVASTIASFLPHSPAKQGELRRLNEYGPAIVKGIAEGIDKATPMLNASMNMMVHPIGAAISTTSSSGGGSATGQNITLILEVDGRTMAQVTAPYIVNQMRLQVGGRQ